MCLTCVAFLLNTIRLCLDYQKLLHEHSLLHIQLEQIQSHPLYNKVPVVICPYYKILHSIAVHAEFVQLGSDGLTTLKIAKIQNIRSTQVLLNRLGFKVGELRDFNLTQEQDAVEAQWIAIDTSDRNHS